MYIHVRFLPNFTKIKLMEKTKEEEIKIRPILSINICGFLTAVVYGYLCFLSKRTGVPLLSIFFVSIFSAWALLLSLFFYLIPNARENFQVTKFILIWALVFRVIGLFSDPIYEDDYYRFLWDGKVFSETGNPYDSTPMDFFDDYNMSQSYQDILNNINNPNLPTIYGPTLEYIFLLSYKIAPGSLFSLKLLFILFDMTFVLVMMKLVSARHLLILSWCPLLIFESTFNAHPDIIGVCFLILSFLFLKKKRYYLSMILFGFAASSKIFALIALPFFIFSGAGIVGTIILIGTIALLYSPFWLQGNLADLSSLLVFASEWEFNSALYGLTNNYLEPNIAKLVCLITFIIFGGLIFINWLKTKTKNLPLHLIFGFFFLVSPVINPWYLLWLLPFAIMRLQLWSIVALAVVGLSYATGLNLGDLSLGSYNHPAWLRPLEFGLIAVAAVFDLYLVIKNSKQNSVTATE